MTAALEARGLDVRFGTAIGLRDLSFDVAAGERFVVLGASGAGKTTLLRALGGLLPIAGGRITIAGRDVTEEPPERRDAVYLHQSPLAFPHLSVFENVAFPLRIRRTGAREIKATVDGLLRSVRLEGLADRPPHTLSGGQRHRMALARAMAARPAVLLLDEPLASLDPSLREEVRGTLIDLQAEYQPAVVLVTHDLDEAAELGHRIGVLQVGRLAQVAPPAVLFRHPASLEVARFLKIPNQVAGRVAAGRFQSPLGEWSSPGPIRDGPVVAVFGVDALRIGDDGVECRVVALQHGPARVLVTVCAGELTMTFAPPPQAIPRPGDLVRLALDPRQVTLCPEATNAR